MPEITYNTFVQHFTTSSSCVTRTISSTKRQTRRDLPEIRYEDLNHTKENIECTFLHVEKRISYKTNKIKFLTTI